MLNPLLWRCRIFGMVMYNYDAAREKTAARRCFGIYNGTYNRSRRFPCRGHTSHGQDRNDCV